MFLWGLVFQKWEIFRRGGQCSHNFLKKGNMGVQKEEKRIETWSKSTVSTPIRSEPGTK